VRINRFVALCGNISRRKADEAIKEGRVSVNGRIVREFVDVDPQKDLVCLDDKRLRLPEGHLYLAFYKPPGFLVSNSSSDGKPLITSFFRDIERKLIFVGRLDFLSEGLLLVTSDGEFAHMVMHPAYEVEKVYLVKTKKPVKAALLKRMERGVQLEDGFFKPVQIRKTQQPQWLLIGIKTGRNRIIRRFFAHFNIPILRLKRIAIGNIELGSLQPGQYRHLTPLELRAFRKLIKRKG